MGIYRGTTPLKAYKGDMQPVNIYRGSTKVAGWHSASYSGASPLTVDCDYDVPPDALVITGKCVQTGTPDPSSPAPISTITGDMTITGADGDASDTATVALGGNVCASLPDGTHDSYDATTGVLTKRVGKYVGASGTSWTISDAISGSSILSDCFGADALSGTGYSAYDAACQPNLTPFFSRSLTDSSYWLSKGKNEGPGNGTLTETSNGWAHINGTGEVWIVFYIKPDLNLRPSSAYTILVEIANASISGSPFIRVTQNYASQPQQFVEATSVNPVANGTYLFNVTSKSTFTDTKTMQRGYTYIPYGASASYDIRLSLYEGNYTGAYKPYALPCEPTVYYKLATPTTVQLTPHLPVVRTGIKTLTVGADVVPTMSATVKSMD